MKIPFLSFFNRKKDKPQEVPVSVAEAQALTAEQKAVRQFAQGLVDVKDIIAPSAIEVDFNHMVIGGKFFRAYFVVDYPTTVVPNWLSPLINFEYPVNISTFYYPRDTGEVLDRLRRKIAEMQATINLDIEAGKRADPTIEVRLRDAINLQQQLAAGSERFFQYALYLTIYADTLEELEKVAKNLESTMASIGLIIKMATLQQEECFQSCLPYGLDKINETRNLDTTSIATTFPFVSAELTMEKGVLYGLNLHNRSLIIFDRFSLPNANSVVFATSGAGKSFAVKLEAVRSLMLGIDIIIIDPEKEYEKLCQSIGGEYISFSQDGSQKLNPFEMSGLYSKDEDELRFKILTVSGLVRMMLGGTLTPEEGAILDRALILTYKEKGITPDPATHKKEPPLLEDLYKVLNSMAENEAHSMARRLEKFVRGSASGVFDQASNVDLKNTFTVFSIRDLTDELRPLAMYTMLDFIWTRIKRDRKKRLLIIDEAWIMMQYPDAARFVYSIAKRARKYALGLTTISQDVEDFLGSDYGKAVVSNSSMQILLKQAPSSIEKLQQVFYLTDGEKQFLLSSGIGEGIFFAGANHVAIQVVASENEYNLINTNPTELLAQQAQADQDKLDITNASAPVSPAAPTAPQPEAELPEAAAVAVPVEAGNAEAAPAASAEAPTPTQEPLLAPTEHAVPDQAVMQEIVPQGAATDVAAAEAIPAAAPEATAPAAPPPPDLVPAPVPPMPASTGAEPASANISSINPPL